MLPRPVDVAILATVNSQQGISVRLTHERWSHIVESHDYMAGHLDLVLETLADPDCIAAGIRDELMALKLYPDTALGRKHVVVVYREGHADGFIVTAFMTSKAEKVTKRGLQWQKSSTS
jgi:hypothetical protein